MVDAHTLHVLEFDKTLNMLAARTRTSMGRERARGVGPIHDADALRDRLEVVSQFKSILTSDGEVSLEGAEDIGPLLKQSQVEGGVLEPADLFRVRETARVMSQTASTLARYRDRHPLAAGEAEGIVPAHALVEEVGRCIDENGRVADRATPRLAEVRKSTGRVRAKLRRHLERYLDSAGLAEARQEDLITIRNGRFVIPIKVEHRGRVPGIVHDRSSSGATVFVEPLDTVELNNELHELEAEERIEVRRVLGTLTRLVAEAASPLRRNLDILAQVDLDFAAARLSIDLRGEPPVLNLGGVVRIRQGRHPLIGDGASEGEGGPVPLDVEIGVSSRALVVTGPNMGGKTVALETVGLLTLMAQSGLHVPAAPGTELAVFENLFADIGDEQSIEENLSTFSSHLRHLVRVLEYADERTLVLLDELGVGTDPEEGVALGISILETLSERNARVMATTHHGAFKIFADDHPWLENASLEFDPQTLRPTYRFRMGIPGASRGLDLAARVGVPSAVLDRARSLLGSERFRLERMLGDLESRLAELERDRASLETERRAARERGQELAGRLKNIREEERTLKEKALDEASRVVRDARKLVERTVEEVRARKADRESIRRARSRIDEAARNLEQARPPAKPGVVLSPEVGDEVWVSTMGRRGVVVGRVDGTGHLTVQSGNVRLRVPLENLTDAPPEEGPRESAGRVRWEGPESGTTELNVLGMTAEEAVESIDRFLDEAIVSGFHEVRVIHGKGKGVLKREVEAALARDPRVRGFRLGNWNEGGWGVTVVTLR